MPFRRVSRRDCAIARIVAHLDRMFADVLECWRRPVHGLQLSQDRLTSELMRELDLRADATVKVWPNGWSTHSEIRCGMTKSCEVTSVQLHVEDGGREFALFFRVKDGALLELEPDPQNEVERRCLGEYMEKMGYVAGRPCPA